jgi:hypothetical protein
MMDAIEEQIIETTISGKTEIGLKEEYVTISKDEYKTLLENTTKTGRWAFFFIVMLCLAAIGLLAFAYVADGLSTENDRLRTEIKMKK